jgi:hypothetical protein
MRDHTKLRAFELVDEVRLDSVRAQRLTAFSLQPKYLSSYAPGDNRSKPPEMGGADERV